MECVLDCAESPISVFEHAKLSCSIDLFSIGTADPEGAHSHQTPVFMTSGIWV